MSDALYAQVITDCDECNVTSPVIITTTNNTNDSMVYVDMHYCAKCGSTLHESVVSTKSPVAIVKSLSTQPIIKYNQLSEGVQINNTWIVDNFESMPNMCSTSKIVYKNDTFYMNVCESNGEATVDLILEIDNKIHRMPFILKKSCQETEPYDMILSV